ncbi:MAG: SemiSWEET transporter [Clostridia bacterium]|nr:SemiSWEET transporter [Clostridia bacterium]
MFFKIIGMVAAVLTTASFLPQAAKTIKTRDTAGISFGMYLMFTVGVLLWFFYGVNMGDLAIITSNAITFILACIILVNKRKNMKEKNEK